MFKVPTLKIKNKKEEDKTKKWERFSVSVNSIPEVKKKRQKPQSCLRKYLCRVPIGNHWYEAYSKHLRYLRYLTGF